jgi:hypothetical protein
MKCDLIVAALADLQCKQTADGARVLTHCLYPNFDQVAVYVQQHLDGYLVHDGGEVFDLAFLEGRNPAKLKGHMRDFAALYGVDSDEHRIFGRALSAAWLPNVVMAVANAAAASASAFVTSRAEQDDGEFRERTYEVLKAAFTGDNVTPRVKRRGRTGRFYSFAFSVAFQDRIALVDTVTPNPISVSTRFTSFSATDARSLGGAFLAYNRPLEAADAALLSEVADVLPLEVLVASIERNVHVAKRVH